MSQVVLEKEHSDKYSLCVWTVIRLNAACLLSLNVCLSVFVLILPKSTRSQSLTLAALCGLGEGCMPLHATSSPSMGLGHSGW